jgi:hypothetical protein
MDIQTMLDIYDFLLVLWILDWVMGLVSIDWVADVFCRFSRLVLNANCISTIRAKLKKKT